MMTKSEIEAMEAIEAEEALALPDMRALTPIKGEVAEIVVQLDALEVVDALSAGVAKDFLDQAVQHRKAIEAWFAPHVDRAHQAHRELTKSRKQSLEAVLAAENLARRKLSEYANATTRDEVQDAGMKTRETWTWTLEDMTKFARAALKDPALLAMLEINKSAMSAYVRATQGVVAIPGVKVATKQVVVAA